MRHAPWLMLVVLLGCVRATRPAGPPRLTVDDIARHLPAKVQDRDGWARDLEHALEVSGIHPDEGNVCAAIAVVEQESGFVANPVVPGLPAIARKALEQKASALGPVGPVVLDELLDGKAPGDASTYRQRLSAVRTEADLDRLYRDILAEQRRRNPLTLVAVDLAARLFSSQGLDARNPVTTAGSMQVSVSFAEESARRLGRDPDRVRDDLYTRQGGLVYGVARLFEGTRRGDMVYRFADYNAGVFASRNAAFQEQVSQLTGVTLALDGDLLAYRPYREDTETVKALLRIPGTRVADVRREKEEALEDTDTWRAVKTAWQARFGKAPAYQRLPDVKLESPKLRRPRTTAWFARSVDAHHRACLGR